MFYKTADIRSLNEIDDSIEEIIDNYSENKTDIEKIYTKYRESEIVDRFRGLKKKVVRDLLDGYNFREISVRLKVPEAVMYKIKTRLKTDLSWVFDDAIRNKYLDENRGQMNDLVKVLAKNTKEMGLAEFVNIYINDYNPEAKFKSWHEIPLQDVYYKQWQSNSKTCIKAPREHLKTTTTCEYLVKRIFEREYPLDIVYLHGSKDIAIEKLRDIQMMAERNPILSSAFMIDQAKNWKDGELRLIDGTTIYANSYGASLVGKHPDIIVLDDVIDQKVIYSDNLNEKSKRKFYSDIYPMITDAGKDKKIIIIGTAQREDDLYESLPTDFVSLTLSAFIDSEDEVPLEPALFSKETLQKVKRDISEKHGERFWLKEYMNKPFTAMGEIIKPEWIKTYTLEPEGLDIFQGWDLSVGKDLDSGDYTAGCTIGIRKEGEILEIYVLDIFKARIEFAERLKVVASSGQRWNPLAIGIEKNTFQYDTVSTLQKQTNLPIQGIQTIRNKIEKFQVDLAPHFENGKVFLRSDMLDFKNELLSLPYGKHDDQVDSLYLAIQISNNYIGVPNISFL